MLTAKLVTEDSELEQIAQLSAANLSTNISAETKAKEGFVTWVYPQDVLYALHVLIPSVIVMDGDKLAGYAITLTRECVTIYPPLAGTVDYVSTVDYKGRPLIEYPIYFMGQICVDKDYRGQGVVEMLYEYHRKQFSPKYSILITEISTKNPRSSKAHAKVGFKVIDTHHENEEEWDLVVWDWA
ncbi:MAG TPA: GNAT family N-acetyltransferase [Puia sp.]|jgi:ribosomal protein S18 acetylase RimI-like enzyme